MNGNFFDVYTNSTNLGRIATTSFVVNGINNTTTIFDASLNLKVNQSYVDASLNLRVDKAYVDASLNLRVDKSYVDASLNLKVNQAYVSSALIAKADQSYVDASLNLKVNQAYVDGSLNTINQTILAIDNSINTLIIDVSNLSVGSSGGSSGSSSGITLDDAVLQIEIEGMLDLPVFAKNWMLNTSSITSNYSSAYCSNSIACSGNGQYVFVGLQQFSGVPLLSKDYGNTWITLTPPFGQTFANVTSCAISSTGQHMVAINNDPNGEKLYYSNNYGSSWTWGNSSGTTSDSVAISSTGKYMLSAFASYLGVSDNYGNNNGDLSYWGSGNSSQLDPSYNGGNFRGRYHAVAMSHDASIMYATTHYRVWKSIDYGTTWTASNNTGKNYSHISCSANGQYVLICPYQLAGDLSNNLYVSNDYGVTFTAKGDIHSYYKGAVSACGRYMVASDGGYYGSYNNFRKGYMYASDDYGQTWNQVNNTPGYYTSIAMSHSGNMIYAQSSKYYGDTGHLYVSNSNYTSCIQTTQPYGSVPDGTIYFDQSNNVLNIYNGKNNYWSSVTLTHP